MKKFLKKIIAAKERRAAELRELIKKSESADEVRSLGETLNSVLEELEDAKKQLEDADGANSNAGDSGNDGTEGRSKIPNTAEHRGLNPAAMNNFNMNQPQQRSENPLDSLEYRQAFKEYVTTGAWNYRADATLVTSDIGKVIPNTIMKEFIKELKTYGGIYKRVRKLNVQGGVEFPIEDLVPTVTWISETTVSETQKTPEIKNSVSFGYHIVEAKIAQSLLSATVSLDYLESEIAKLLAEAFIKEFDRVIVNGSGSGQPLGILNDTRVKDDHKIAFSAAELADWTKWRTKLFAKIPVSYRGGGIFITTAANWESYFMTLKDANNNPISKETFNVEDGETECKFAGRTVILVEPDILKDFDTAASDDAFAVFFRPEDYAINTNLQLYFKRYFNEDTNKWINKGLCIMDGKLLDTNGVYVLKK